MRKIRFFTVENNLRAGQSFPDGFSFSSTLITATFVPQAGQNAAFSGIRVPQYIQNIYLVSPFRFSIQRFTAAAVSSRCPS